MAVASLGSYLVAGTKRQLRDFDIRPTIQTWDAIQRGDTFPIDRIEDVADADTFLRRASGLKTYEPLFGYVLETFRPTTAPGPVRAVVEGRFNMTFPAGLVFPALNGVAPFERIPATDGAAFESFVARRDPGWRRPWWQHALDRVSGLSAAGLLLYGVVLAARRMRGLVRSVRGAVSR